MADVVQGNVQAAYQAYFDNMNPAPFAQIVRTHPTVPRCRGPGPGAATHGARARAGERGRDPPEPGLRGVDRAGCVRRGPGRRCHRVRD